MMNLAGVGETGSGVTRAAPARATAVGATAVERVAGPAEVEVATPIGPLEPEPLETS